MDPVGLADRLANVRARVADAARAGGRAPDAVTLLAVSKTFGPDIVAAAAALGQRAFGENYVQEGVAKIALAGAGLQWHFIGPIQSNKTRAIAEHFDWVQSLERVSIARRLSTQRPASLAPLQVLLQVNADAEDTKSGVAPEALLDLAGEIAELPRLALRGLMAIPRPESDAAVLRATFARLRALFERLRAAQPGVDTLSMGMSGDFELAIAEGSTLVRVGSALFGERK
jgi:PLP dependent protein